MEFDPFLGQAWDEHAGDAAGVAARLEQDGPRLADTEGRVAALANLVHHVHGEHLGRWADGRALLQRLAAAPACPAGSPAAAAVARLLASLELCAGGADTRAAMSPSERIRVSALAAANLSQRDTARATALLAAALAEAASAGLDDSDPAHRTLAVTANNLACTLEEKTGRSTAERGLMITSALAARRHWALAGTWLETERAEYRLAMTWLQAGDPAQARHHALQCLALVDANAGPALERFFAHEALALAERAAGHDDAAAQAVVQARADFAALDDGDRGWCQATLDKLAA